MKKTLIAMFALAGVAMADTTTVDILAIPESISQITLANAGTYGWDQNIGAQKNITGKIVADCLGVTVEGNSFMPNGWSWGVANVQNAMSGDVTTEVTGQAVQFHGRQGYGGEFVAGIVDVADLVAATDNATGISALTFGFNKSTGENDMTFSVWHWDGTSEEATALVAKTTDLSTKVSLGTPGNSFSWSGEELTNGKILVVFSESSAGTANTFAAWQAKATLNIASVPEPATATLSLLALAGLAARRRRH